MEFRIKTWLLLEKEYVIETTYLKDALDETQRRMAQHVDIDWFDRASGNFALDDPSMRDYHRELFGDKKEKGGGNDEVLNDCG